MNFTLALNVNQINTVIKGLESLRDTSNDLVQNIMGQVQIQAQAQQAATNLPAAGVPASDVAAPIKKSGKKA